MTAAEYLGRARTLDLEIGAKQRELMGIKMNAQSLHSPLLGEKVLSTPKNEANKAIDKAVDLDDRIKEELAELIDIKAELHARVNNLTNRRYVTVLTDYYINCMTIEEVAEAENYSTSQVKRLRCAAVKEFAEVYGFIKDEPK